MNAPLPLVKVIRPQPGPQEAFLSSTADIAIYGGAAYSGKTFAILLEPLRHIEDGTFSGVIFRRESPQITNPGAMWDESVPLYKQFGSGPVRGNLEHRFPSGANMRFGHLEHDDTVYNWDGAQIPFIGFDQLEHFSAHQFFYMLSRNRCPSGTVRSYMRATCNPDPDSWLAKFIGWWIDPDTGYPIPERSGAVRWFVREGEEFIWADTREELLPDGIEPDPTDPEAVIPKSVTFIAGTIFDNKIGMKNDPGYLGSLKALNPIERARLLGGNWKIRPAAGLLFQRAWCQPLRAAPTNIAHTVRYWDLAATKPIEKGRERKPAWTVGVKLGRYKDHFGIAQNRYVILDVRRMQDSPANVRKMIRNTAEADGPGCVVGVPQDPGQAGKDQAQQMVGLLSGYQVRVLQESGDKVTRFGAFSAQCEHGNVDYVLDSVPDAYLTSLENFPDGVVKDDADSSSGAFSAMLLFAPVNLHGIADEVPEPSAQEDADAPWNILGDHRAYDHM